MARKLIPVSNRSSRDSTTLSMMGRGTASVGGAFRAEVLLRGGGFVVVDLFGELDVVSMAKFETALELSLSGSPEIVIVDVSRTGFICGAGYRAIGRCSLQVKRLVVCCRGSFAEKMLGVLGYEDVNYVDVTVQSA
jgi:hypothetical protein